MNELLSIYLNDHLAGSTAGVELAKRLRESNRGDPEFGPDLVDICAEIEVDRDTLISIMDRLGVSRDRVKPVAAYVGERLARLKMNGQLRGYSPLSRVLELEMLQIGVAGKRRLWRALEITHAEELEDFGLAGLGHRAAEQLTRLEALHMRAVELAFVDTDSVGYPTQERPTK